MNDCLMLTLYETVFALVKMWIIHPPELRAFKERHGHIIVPQIDEYKSLNGFINHQRHNHRMLVEGKNCKGLTAERIQDLEEVSYYYS